MYILVDNDGNRLTPDEYDNRGEALVDALMMTPGTFQIVPKES